MYVYFYYKVFNDIKYNLCYELNLSVGKWIFFLYGRY